jgi:catechol 2,3-dioxygenase-like lactoylglutathione lyase family enzyme
MAAMPNPIDRLFDAYDRGQVSRRGLMQALIPLLVAAPAASAAETLTVKTINHVSLAVSDIDRSRQFYQDLFSAPIVSRQSNGINLDMGPNSFLGLYKIGAPSINHFCLGIDGTVQSAAAVLEKHNVKAQIRDRDGVKELYFRDPDNIMVQLQEASYRG